MTQTNDSTSKTENGVPDEQKEGIGYDVLLTCRTSDPIADSLRLEASELPSHWLPTITTQVSRATSSAFGLNSTDGGERSSHSETPPQKRSILSAHKQAKTESVMPHLTFQNPWKESFRKPGLRDLLGGGLQWGIPHTYVESQELEEEEAKNPSADHKDKWDVVEVKEPDWGQSANQRTSKKTCPEWFDEEKGVNAARVTWLGHATTLLQLPPLDPALPEDPVLNKESEPMVDSREDDVDSDSESDEIIKDDPPKAATKSTDDKSEHAAPMQREAVGHRSINILFDPVFSQRCSPSQAAGPQRFTPAPCKIKQLPPIDIVCISHSHYDHLDYQSLRKLRALRQDRIHAFVGLGVKQKLIDFGWKPSQVSEMDWWDAAVMQTHVEPPPSPEPDVSHNVQGSTATAYTANDSDAAANDDDKEVSEGEKKLKSLLRSESDKLRIICTPAQHGSGRGAGDKDASLWASWVVEWIPKSSSAPVLTGKTEDATFRAFFAGDTGLKYHHDNTATRHKYPACPAFAQIRDRVGVPDLLLLPISVGSSLSYFRSWDPFPRGMSPFPRVSAALTSSIHMDPWDAVETHEIMRAPSPRSQRPQVSLAVHYGTFVENSTQTRADVRELANACAQAKLPFRRTPHGRFSLDLKPDRVPERDNAARLIQLEEKDKGAFLVSHQGETVWIPFTWTKDQAQ